MKKIRYIAVLLLLPACASQNTQEQAAYAFCDSLNRQKSNCKCLGVTKELGGYIIQKSFNGSKTSVKYEQASAVHPAGGNPY